MKKIGITGGIGSGKTTVCKVFELLGVPVFYADDEAKKLLGEDAEVKEAVVKAFGSILLNGPGLINKKKLAEIVFNNSEKLQELNSIVHPVVRRRFEEWSAKHSSCIYVLEEAAILFESGAYKFVDHAITIIAPEELRIERVMQRDKSTSEQVKTRIQNQMNDAEKIKRSQFVIVNDEHQLLIPQILDIHKELTIESV